MGNVYINVVIFLSSNNVYFAVYLSRFNFWLFRMKWKWFKTIVSITKISAFIDVFFIQNDVNNDSEANALFICNVNRQ